MTRRETGAAALATISNLGIAWALWYLTRFGWWFLLYLLWVAVPVLILVPMSLLLAGRLAAEGGAGPKRYVRGSWWAFGLWCGAASIQALRIPWSGH